MLYEKYIVTQMNVWILMEVGESNSAMTSVEFHWHKCQWGKEVTGEYSGCHAAYF